MPPSRMPDGQSSREPPTYRAYRVSPGGRVSAVAIILDAANDGEAIAQARVLVDGVGIEVWDRTRLIVALPPRLTSR